MLLWFIGVNLWVVGSAEDARQGVVSNGCLHHMAHLLGYPMLKHPFPSAQLSHAAWLMIRLSQLIKLGQQSQR